MNEENSNTSGNPSLNDVIDARLSRRNMLRVGMGSAGAAVLGSLSLSACGGGGDDAPAPAPAQAMSLSFSPVGKSTADVLTVPTGYTATPIFALGDPLNSAAPAFKNDGTDTDFETRAGDHHDGMEWFGLDAQGRPSASSTQRALLAINHEATTD